MATMLEVTRALADALRAVVGSDGLIEGPEERAAYECDAYTLERHVPGLVVLPGNVEEVVAVVRLCARHGVAIVPRGAGTSLSGGSVAATGGVVVAVTRMNRVLAVDERNRRVLVEAGCVNAWVTTGGGGGGLVLRAGSFESIGLHDRG